MPVTVKIGPYFATIDNYKWHSEHEVLEKALNARLDPAGPSGADHWPDYTAAQEAVERFRGEIVEAAEKPDFKPRRGVVY